jgi:alpha-ribazole phosphatase
LKLYLVRHPRPAHVQGLCYGRQDVPISAAALDQALASIRAHPEADALLRCKVFSSPSTRCLLLARALAAPRAVTRSDDLRELDFGAWEGRPWDALPRDELDAWAADVWDYRPGGVESAAMVADRWRRWSAWLQRSGVASALAVTHAGVIRVARLCSGTLGAGTFAQAVIEHGSVHRIELAALRSPA